MKNKTVLVFIFILLFSSQVFASVSLTNRQMEIFNQNGISAEDVKLNIDFMRSEGKNDKEIQDKILDDIEILSKQEQSSHTSNKFFYNYQSLFCTLFYFLFIGLVFALIVKFKMKILELLKKIFNKHNYNCCKNFIKKNWFKIGLLSALFYIAMKI